MVSQIIIVVWLLAQRWAAQWAERWSVRLISCGQASFWQCCTTIYPCCILPYTPVVASPSSSGTTLCRAAWRTGSILDRLHFQARPIPGASSLQLHKELHLWSWAGAWGQEWRAEEAEASITATSAREITPWEQHPSATLWPLKWLNASDPN